MSRPLVFERAAGFQPTIRYPHEMIQGIENPCRTSPAMCSPRPKNNPLVELSLVSPVPAGQDNNAILASWTYGLGKAVVLDDRRGQRWAIGLDRLEQNYDRLFSQIVRWSMRPPTAEDGKIHVSQPTSAMERCGSS